MQLQILAAIWELVAVTCIAFPMNGPVECLKKLLCLDEKYCPPVTFLGPRDEWMKKAGKYKYLY
jgi:hypothetical protein